MLINIKTEIERIVSKSIRTEDIKSYHEDPYNKKETIIEFYDDRDPINVKETFEVFHNRLVTMEDDYIYPFIYEDDFDDAEFIDKNNGNSKDRST